jgi:hypothetical protein
MDTEILTSAEIAEYKKLKAEKAKQLEYQKRLAAKNAIILREAKKQGITATKDEIDAHLADA